MASEIFLTSMVGDGTRAKPFRGKHTGTAGVTKSGTLRYARQNAQCLIMLEADQAVLDIVESDSDVIRLATESNIDDVMPASEITALRSQLETNFIAGEIIKDAATRRSSIRCIAGVHLFSQRYEGRHGKSLPTAAGNAGKGFDHNPNGFPSRFRTELNDVWSSCGWDSDITSNKTLRQIQISCSEQMGTKEIFIAGFKI